MHVTALTNRASRTTFLAWATFFIAIFFTIQSLCAESLFEVHGLNFRVENITPVDSSNSRVTVLGQTRILANTEIKQFVVSQYLSNPELFFEFSPDKLKSFTKRAVNAKEHNLASVGLRVLLQHPAGSDEDLVELIDVLSHEEVSSQIFRELLLVADSKFSVVGTLSMLLYVGLEDFNWIRANVVRLIYLYPGELKSAIHRNFAIAIREEKLESLDGIVKFTSSALGSEDDFTQRLRMLASEANYIFSVIERGRIDELDASAYLKRQDPAYLEILYPVVVTALYEAIDEATAAGEHSRALFLLAKSSMERRTPKTHELIAVNLKNLSLAEGSVLTGSRVREMLVFISTKDEVIRQRYIEVLGRLIYHSIENQNFSEADIFFASLIEVRPDPHAVTDGLRFEYAVALVRAGHLVHAERVLDQIENLSFFDRFRLALLKLRLGGLKLNIPLFIALAAVLLFGILFLVQRYIERKKANSSSNGEEDDEKDAPAGFSYVDHLKNLNPRRQEYNRCLAVLGLDPGADKQAIKTAYRSALKEAHPDIQHGKDLKASARFIEVTKAYERVMKLEEQFQFSVQGHLKPDPKED